MNSITQNWKTILVTFIIIGFVGYFVWHTLFFFISLLKQADAKISATIIGGMITFFSGIAAVTLTQRHIKIRQIEEAHREKKVGIYQEFFAIIARMIQGQNERTSIENLPEQELIDFLVNFKTDIMLWGSPNVLLAQADFESKSPKDPIEMFTSLDLLYRAIREDIGLSNRGLPPLHLIKMYMSDPEELEKMRSDTVSENK